MDVPEEFAKLVHPGFKLAPGESLDTCPYNPYHYCMAHKAGRHVAKCRKAFMKKHGTAEQGVDLIGCRYTEIHSVPAIEIPWHQERCPYKDYPQTPSTMWKPVVPKSNKSTLKDLTVPQLEQIIKENSLKGVEDWDVEAILFQKTHYPFDPVQAIVNAGAPWCPPGLNKSERKEFRIAHREFANVKRGGTYIPSMIQK